MLKKFICGAVLLGALGFGGPTPAQARELYVSNRPFVEAQFIGDTSYVPVDTFLKAVDVPWTVEGNTVMLGQGSSPDIRVSSERINFNADGKQASLLGILRNGQIYVPADELARLVGYGVVTNQHTGVIDIVKAHIITERERQIAAQVKAEAEAEAAARRAKWQERVAKFRAEKEAKEAAAAEAEGEEGEFYEDEDVDPDDAGARKKKPPKVATKEPEAAPAPAAAEDEEEEAGPPPKAELVVLSKEADPNTYTGEVNFRVIIQNQGFANATNVKANLKVMGSNEGAGRGQETWINKTVYHPGPIAPDGRWEITEQYTHRLGGQAVTGNIDVNVTPIFESAPPKEG